MKKEKVKKVKFLRSVLATMVLAGAFGIFLASCSDDSPAANNNNGGNETPEGIAGDMTAITFAAGKKYLVTGDLFVPENKSVTIPSGTTFEFQEGKMGEAWFIEVFGSLYVLGSENARVVFTASDALLKSKKNLGVGQLWGGIIGTVTTGDLVIQYADVMHAGGSVREENAMAMPATGGDGELAAGDASYAMYFIREDGKRQDGIFVLNNSYIAFAPDDAIRINGGKTLFSYNVFEVTGSTGGDAVNIKAGSSGDFGFNFFYNVATNGLKAADTGPGVRGKLEVNFYNNTVVASGYRRAEPGRGAGLNYESKSFGKVYNNLLVNTRFGLRLVAGETEPDVTKLQYGYNWYYGAVQTVVAEFYPTANTNSKGLIGNDPRTPIPSTDVTGAPKANDPMFVNFDPSTFVFSGNASISTDPLAKNVSPRPAGSDFRLKSNSPARTGGLITFSPVYASYTSLDGKLTFTPPAPKAYFGAYGTN